MTRVAVKIQALVPQYLLRDSLELVVTLGNLGVGHGIAAKATLLSLNADVSHRLGG